MPQLLPVPYHPQKADGYCLAACAQMVLHYWGIVVDQEQLARQLGVESGVGVPAGRIKRLASRSMSVTYDLNEPLPQSVNPANPLSIFRPDDSKDLIALAPITWL